MGLLISLEFRRKKMHQFFEFLINHWILSSLFIILLILLFVEEARTKGAGGIGISVQKLTDLVNKENAVILDIRQSNDFKDGHIINAINIPQDVIDKSMNRIEKYKNKTIILVDTTGQKTMSIVKKLNKSGFSKVHALMGGMNAWQKANMPVIKK